MKIDLGCGGNKRPGFIGVDLDESVKPDIVANVCGPISALAPGCANFVLCSHVLEHLPTAGFNQVMSEIHRLLRPGGEFEIRVPHPSSDEAMIHDHKHVLTPFFWVKCQDENWLNGRLIIDHIQEIENPKCQEAFQDRAHDYYEVWKDFLRNAFTETVVKGRKPNG